MQKFTVHKGLVAPMDRENVDTDAIIPKQFLKLIREIGFGLNLFNAWRYLDAGFSGQDSASCKLNQGFGMMAGAAAVHDHFVNVRAFA